MNPIIKMKLTKLIKVYNNLPTINERQRICVIEHSSYDGKECYRFITNSPTDRSHFNPHYDENRLLDNLKQRLARINKPPLFSTPYNRESNECNNPNKARQIL
jgi:hypothetical protein|tara:strand:- start:2019 stop:2327 length:309 start_codon:yes stop_codon:yes gene_type:complete